MTLKRPLARSFCPLGSGRPVQKRIHGPRWVTADQSVNSVAFPPAPRHRTLS